MRGHAQVRGVRETGDTILSSEWELERRKGSRWFPSPPPPTNSFLSQNSKPLGFCSHPVPECALLL